MKKMTFILISTTVILSSCGGVSRENPFDPLSADYVGRAPQDISATDGDLPESIVISWSPCTEAREYAVLREEEGQLLLIGRTAECRFTDSNVNNNQEYNYRISAIFADGNNGEFSATDTGFAHIPVVQNLSATDGSLPESVDLSWDAVEHASGYTLYKRKDGESEWSTIDVGNTAAYTDTETSDRQNYTYKISAYFTKKIDGDPSETDTGYSQIPQVEGVSATDGTLPESIEITWNEVPGASGYFILREQQNGSFAQLGTSTTNSYTDTLVSDLEVHSYKICAFYTKKVGGKLSTVDTGYALKLDPPSFITTQRGDLDGTITIEYGAVSGAERYDIYRSEGSPAYLDEEDITGYTKVGSTEGVIFDDTLGIENGKQYYYKVKAVSDTCSRYSNFSPYTWGLALEHYAIPQTSIVMLRIPKGTFVMGEDGVAEPMHTVHITRDFYMSESEITYEQWISVKNKADFLGYQMSSGLRGSVDAGEASQPVTGISWEDALQFCNALCQIDGFLGVNPLYLNETSTVFTGTDDEVQRNTLSDMGYRLPFEFEWEYACRAWTNTSFYWGDEYTTNAIKPYSWMDYTGTNQSSPVMQLQPNNFALYDMAGNVWEICWDPEYVYSMGSQTNPIGTSDEYELRIKRGGSYQSFAGDIRSGNRASIVFETGQISTGFRIARYAE